LGKSFPANWAPIIPKSIYSRWTGILHGIDFSLRGMGAQWWAYPGGGAWDACPGGGGAMRRCVQVRMLGQSWPRTRPRGGTQRRKGAKNAGCHAIRIGRFIIANLHYSNQHRKFQQKAAAIQENLHFRVHARGESAPATATFSAFRLTFLGFGDLAWREWRFAEWNSPMRIAWCCRPFASSLLCVSLIGARVARTSTLQAASAAEAERPRRAHGSPEEGRSR